MIPPLVRTSALLVMLAAAPCAAAADTLSFLVFPPQPISRSSPLQWASEGLAYAIAQQLESETTEVVDREMRLGALESGGLPQSGALSRASMIRIAQGIGVDYLVYGAYSGNLDSIRVAVQVLDLRTLKLGPEIVSAGSVAQLPDIENELAWQILAQAGGIGAQERDKFRARMRSIGNEAFSHYIRSLGASDPEQQIQLVTKALELHRDFPEALFLAGRHHYRKGDYARALELLSERPALPRHFVETQFMLGSCHYRQGSFGEAVRYYTSILPASGRVEVHNNLGAACLRFGDLPRAATHLSAARSLARTDPIVSLNLAIARRLQGDERSAQAILEESLAVHPEHPLLHYVLSDCLKAQGAEARAGSELARAVHFGADADKLRTEDFAAWMEIVPEWVGTR